MTATNRINLTIPPELQHFHNQLVQIVTADGCVKNVNSAYQDTLRRFFINNSIAYYYSCVPNDTKIKLAELAANYGVSTDLNVSAPTVKVPLPTKPQSQTVMKDSPVFNQIETGPDSSEGVSLVDTMDSFDDILSEVNV